jgi:hypothetical protein
MTDTYYGWTNYPTFAVFSWLANDEYTHQEAEEVIKNAQDSEAALKRHVEDLIYGDEYEACMRTDLIDWALGCVNWREVVHGLVEE